VGGLPKIQGKPGPLEGLQEGGEGKSSIYKHERREEGGPYAGREGPARRVTLEKNEKKSEDQYLKRTVKKKKIPSG